MHYGVTLALALYVKFGERLPGDIVVEGDNFKFYTPITMDIILSVLINLVSWLLREL
jgi:Protein of unknown function (DUF2905)